MLGNGCHMAGTHRSAIAAASESHLEPGDRLEVVCTGPTQLQLISATTPCDILIHALEGAQGQALPVSFDPENHLLTVGGVGRVLPERYSALWLEFREAGRFSLVVDPVLPNQ